MRTPKPMKFAFVQMLVLAALCASTSAKDVAMRLSSGESVVLDVVTDVTFSTVKRSLDVRLGRRFTESHLKEFAEFLRKLDSRQYQRTFIMFYLPEMKIDSGAWATAIYQPELQIRIIGSTKEQYDKLQVSAPSDVAEKRIGRWLDGRAGLDCKMELVMRGDLIQMRYTYKDGSNSAESVESVASTSGQRVTRVSRKSRGEFYVINGEGDLEFWDAEGRFYVAKKMD